LSQPGRYPRIRVPTQRPWVRVLIPARIRRGRTRGTHRHPRRRADPRAAARLHHV